MVRAQALSLLKEAVCSLAQLRVVVLDLSKAQIVEASRLRMLVSLHNWACVNGIHLKLVNPCNPVGQLCGQAVMNYDRDSMPIGPWGKQ